MNSYELSVVENHLQKCGFIKTKLKSDDANIIILNTCSVTSVSDQKSRKMINHFRNHYPLAKLLVMGCFVEGNPDYSFNDNEVGIGVFPRKRIIEEIDRCIDKNVVSSQQPKWMYEEFGYTYNQNRRIPEIKIEDGCNNSCSYCRVSEIRGPVRSRLKEHILNEIQYLYSEGKRRFILVGINLGEYGLDFNNYRLCNLLTDVVATFPDIEISLSSLELSTITDDLLKILKTTNQIKHHFHIPLQSGSSKILELMNRTFNKKDYLKKITEIKDVFPDATFSSDIIVGFPQETEEDFLETIDVVERVSFTKIHIFPYSIRPNTVAATLDGQIDAQTKKDRFMRLNKFNSK